MKTTQLLRTFWAVLLLLVGAAISTKGSTIYWGTFYNDVLLNSAGAPLDAGYTFEIGTFDLTGGWAPTTSNFSEWEGRWMVFDAATEGAGWTSGDHFVNTSVDHTLSGGSSSPDAIGTDVFLQGTAAYLWVYNSKQVLPTSEWALLMDTNTATNTLSAWVFPDPAEQNGESYDWQTRDLDTAIVGSMNIGPRDLNTGDYLDPGSYTLQTQPVPEPGSAMLILVAAGALIRRRKTLDRAGLNQL